MKDMGTDSPKDVTAFSAAAAATEKSIMKTIILTTHSEDANHDAQEKLKLLREDTWFGSLVGKGVGIIEECQTEEQWNVILQKVLKNYEKRRNDTIKLRKRTIDNLERVNAPSKSTTLEQDSTRPEGEIDAPSQKQMDGVAYQRSEKEGVDVSKTKEHSHRDPEAEWKNGKTSEVGRQHPSDKIVLESSTIGSASKSIPPTDTGINDASHSLGSLNDSSPGQQNPNTDVPVTNDRAPSQTSQAYKEPNTTGRGTDATTPSRNQPPGTNENAKSGLKVCPYQRESDRSSYPVYSSSQQSSTKQDTSISPEIPKGNASTNNASQNLRNPNDPLPEPSKSFWDDFKSFICCGCCCSK